MIYYLKKTKPSKTRPDDIYLQIYTNTYDAKTKSKRHKCYKTLGYVSKLTTKDIPDPISYYEIECKKLNEELNGQKVRQISEGSTHKYLGHFLINNLFNLLNVDEHLDIVGSNYKCHYKFSSMFRALCFAQILCPSSKHKAFEKVIPNIYGCDKFSYDQILDFVNFLGCDYHKYIEVFNKHINDIWKRDLNNVYFDCTNYYFEIDIENDTLKKGPSKENRRCPLLGQALLLDADQIPLDTEFYPGNQSEKPYLRKRIENMKNRNNVTGKVVQVADKGLNCAINIYAAIKNNDGYIFSKSVKKADKDFKKWIIDNEDWINIYDKSGKLLYKYKTFKTVNSNNEKVEYGSFEYKCKLEDDTKYTTFNVLEKRILTYNPSLARKQINEINKEVEKVINNITYKKALKEELGDAAKYAKFEAYDENGKEVKIATSVNYDKVDEDKMLAGYNLIVTSEINKSAEEIYRIYHNLWRIENSFRILKTHLEARPAYVQIRETILGHFLICYISLTLLRLLELKIFNDEISIESIVEFIRYYNVTEYWASCYVNTATYSQTYEIIKKKLGISKLGNAYLSKKDIDTIYNAKLPK